MDINTLLTRQMELHGALRQVPKTPAMLSDLYKNFEEYCRFLDKLRDLSRKLESGPDVLFDCLLHSDLIAGSSFSSQSRGEGAQVRQDKSVEPRRLTTIESHLRELLPNVELLESMDLCKRICKGFRAKLKNREDFRMLEKNIKENMEYLNFIYSKACGNAEMMFSLFMVEGIDSLLSLLRTCGDNETAGEAALSSTGASSSFFNSSRFSSKESESRVSEVLPSPLSTFAGALTAKCAIAEDAKRTASERLHSTQIIADWIAVLPIKVFNEQMPKFLPALTRCLNALAGEARSSLCRLGCEAMTLFLQRAVSIGLLPVVSSFGGSLDGLLGQTLGLWATTLLTRVFVTVAAISTAIDFTLRELLFSTCAHPDVVRSILSALERGTQPELRRKGLGYLILSLVLANKSSGTGRRLGQLLVEPAQRHVQIGDSTIRKMSRALCVVLTELCQVKLDLDEKTCRLMELERRHLLPLLDCPRELEKFLFGPRQELLSSYPAVPRDPDGQLFGSTKAYHLRLGAVKRCSQEESCSPGLEQSELLPANSNRPLNVLRKNSTLTAESKSCNPEDSSRDSLIMLLARRGDAYNRDALSSSTLRHLRDGHVASPKDGAMAFVTPKQTTRAPLDGVTIKTSSSRAKTINAHGEVNSNFSPSRLDTCPIGFISNASRAPNVLSARNISHSLACVNTVGDNCRTALLSLMHAGGQDEGREQHLTHVFPSDHPPAAAIDYPEILLSNTLRRKIAGSKTRQ